MLPSTRSSIEPPRPRVQHQSRIPTGIKSSIIVFLLSFFIFRYITSPLYTLSNHRNIPLGFIYKIFLRQNWSKKEKKPHGEKRGYYFIRRLLHAHSAMSVAVQLYICWTVGRRWNINVREKKTQREFPRDSEPFRGIGCLYYDLPLLLCIFSSLCYSIL